MPSAVVNGVNLFFERRGAGDPLLFISGLGGHAAEVTHLADSYGRHFEFVTFDGRGCGRSDKPEGDYSIAGYSDDAAALMDAIGLDSAVVYGSSMGGMVAQELTLRHPERVRALILGCTTGGAIRGVQPSAETIERMIRNQQLTGDEALVAGWGLGYSTAHIDANFDMLLARARAASAYVAPKDSYMRQVLASAQHDVWDRLQAITCPVMIIHGSDDVMIPVGNARMLAERIPHAELYILEGAGHGYNLEHQARADALVIDFARRTTQELARAAR